MMDLRSEAKDEQLARQVADDYRAAPLGADVAAVLDFSVKLTRTPGEMKDEDVERLRRHGWNDRAIHDIVQVAAYFNYINRVADGLGIDLEPGMPPRPDRS